MMTSLGTAKRFVFPLLGLWVLLYASFSMVRPPLLDGDDALNAEIAREMATTGHWITPYANGIRYAQHPPLLYWTVATSFRIFGVSDWAARLPVALATLFIFVATFSLGRRLFCSKQAAFYSTLTLITSYGVFLFGHLLLRDVFLCLWTTLAVNFFWKSLTQERHKLSTALGFGACCALGVLTEGIAGVVFPVATALIYLAITRNLRHVLRWNVIAAVVLFFAMIVPWHIASQVTAGNPRLETLMPAISGGRVPLVVFWPLLLLWIVPWCAFSIRALKLGDSPDCLRGQGRILCVTWILVVLVYYSFAARLEFNLMTALPPMALLAGGWLAQDEERKEHQARVIEWVVLWVALAAAAFVAYSLWKAPIPPPGVDIATLLHPHAGHRAVFFAYLADLTRRAMGLFKVPLAIMLAALLVGAIGGLWYRLHNNARMANMFLAGMIVGMLIAAHLALNTFSPILSSQILAEAIKPEVHPSDVIVVNGPFDTASSFVFYLERQVLVVDGRRAPKQMETETSGTETSGTGQAVNPSLFINMDEVAQRWSGPDRVWLWTPVETAPTLPAPSYVIGRSGGKEVLSNQPNSGGASF